MFGTRAGEAGAARRAAGGGWSRPCPWWRLPSSASSACGRSWAAPGARAGSARWERATPEELVPVEEPFTTTVGPPGGVLDTGCRPVDAEASDAAIRAMAVAVDQTSTLEEWRAVVDAPVPGADTVGLLGTVERIDGVWKVNRCTVDTVIAAAQGYCPGVIPATAAFHGRLPVVAA